MGSERETPTITLYGIRLPEVKQGDSISDLVIECARSQGIELVDGDVVVVTSKILSKALGHLVNIAEVRPSERAVKIAKRAGLDPRLIEVILRESDDVLLAIPLERLVDEGLVDLKRISRDPERALSVVRSWPTVFLTVREGQLWSDSGLDSSNHPEGVYSIPPRDLDRIARRISEEIYEKTGRKVAVVITDTEVFLMGSLDFARGSYGISPISRNFGELDRYGKPKLGGIDAVVHEVAAASALLMGQCAEGIPVVIVRGLRYEFSEEGISSIRVGRDVKVFRRIILDILRTTIKVLGVRHLLRLIFAGRIHR